jgi:hypothetical protein
MGGLVTLHEHFAISDRHGGRRDVYEFNSFQLNNISLHQIQQENRL